MSEMIYYKTDEEIKLIRESSLLVGKTLAEVVKWIKIGTTTKKLDDIAEEFILDNNAIPGFKGYNKFPNTLCISINEEVVHGIPSDERILKEGDIVSIDCGVIKNEFYGDSAYTFEVGEISDEKKQLLKVTKEALYKAIAVSIVGKRVGDISYEVQQHANEYGYSVVRELVGHGVGRDLHEKPQLPNYGKRGRGTILQEGLVIAIEPMINIGGKDVYTEKDKWTIVTKDGTPSAHYEHTVAVRKGKAEILSTFAFIEEALGLKKNEVEMEEVLV